ncbi:uncharacterized protein LOC128518372 [Clarias gariepinus]|uniref:uncharacterized protein LOC128518372 n=1 Tax=Clarias gariepinus TaxID=13013 RepID=UPI00234E09C7|nr:uncharacterized protein LOC128518372 [Clarias gariepinus]
MRGGVEDSRLRPLLCMAGGAAAAAGVYRYIKRREKSTSEPGSTTGAEDPMWATELNLVQPSECPQAQVVDTVNEARERIEMLMASNAQLVNKLKELERLLSEARRDADMKSKQCERDQKAHTTLKAEKDEIQKTLILKEELLKAHTILQMKNDERKKTLIYQEELLKVTLAEAQEKEKKAIESITRLEAEKSELTNKVKELQSTVEKLGRLLDKNQRKCEDLTNECERELEVHTILLAENEEMMKTLIRQEKLLKVTRADAKAIAVLEAEKSDLIDNIKKLQSTVKDLGIQLYKTQHEHKQEQEAYTILQAQKDELKKTLIQNEELLKEKQQKAVRFITQLKTERSELMDKVKKLQRAVERLEGLLDKIQRKSEDLTNSCLGYEGFPFLGGGGSALSPRNCVLVQKNMTKGGFSEGASLNLHVDKRVMLSNIPIRTSSYKLSPRFIGPFTSAKIIDPYTIRLMDLFTLAEAQEKQQKAVESITSLETERSVLMDKVKELQSTVETLSRLVDKNQKKCEDLMNECEQEREAHTILLGENEEIKKNLIQQEELLKISLANAKAKEKKAEEDIANLEAEKSELIAKAKKKQSTMEKVRNALYKTEKKYEDLTNEKQQIAVESTTRLETERSELMDKVKELQSTVKKLGNLLDKDQRRCQYLMNKCDREPHSILHAENEAIKKTLLQEEQLLKFV